MTEPFDKQALLEELDGDREFLQESLEILDSDAPQLLEKIQHAIELGDPETVAVSAHTFKSMVGNFCAAPAQQAALDVETHGRAGDLDACRGGIDLLEHEAQRLRKALHELLEDLSTGS